jgi:zinc transporter
VQARARLLQDEMMARIGEQSNRLLSALSIMTAVLLPSTVISGLFGMNTRGLPFSASPHGFWIVTVLSGAFVLAAFLIVRRVGGPR